VTRRDLLKMVGATGAVAIAAACAPAPTSGGPTGSAAPVATTAASAAPAVPPDKLVAITPEAVDTLDPHVSVRAGAGTALKLIHDTLIDHDPQSMAPVGLLATSWKAVDDKTWEFKLRSGVKFTNGEAFTASVVKANFERIVKPELKSSTGTTLAGIIAGVDAVDDSTVRFRLKAPYGMLLERLQTWRMISPQEQKARGDDGLATNPVGTGPYKFVEWKQGQQVVLDRNEDYWGTKPYFKQIVIRLITEGATAQAELLAGNAHMVLSITPDQVKSIKDSGVADVAFTPTVLVLEARMDALARGGPNPFTDKRVRQAANYAVDKEAIAKNLLGGYSQVVGTNISPLMFGYDANVKPYPYDPAKAKELLTAAGYANGLDVQFNYFPVTGFANTPDIVQAIAADLGKVGIRAKLNSVGATEYQNIMNAGKIGPIFTGGNQNGGFFDGGFGFFYLKKSLVASYYYSDELDKLIAVIETSADQEARKKALSDVQKLLHEEAPYIWGWTGYSLIAGSKKLDFKAYPDVSPRLNLVKPKG
jgi:peptide/nickel transport system substrate-binding protein